MSTVIFNVTRELRVRVFYNEREGINTRLPEFDWFPDTKREITVKFKNGDFLRCFFPYRGYRIWGHTKTGKSFDAYITKGRKFFNVRVKPNKAVVEFSVKDLDTEETKITYWSFGDTFTDQKEMEAHFKSSNLDSFNQQRSKLLANPPQKLINVTKSVMDRFNMQGVPLDEAVVELQRASWYMFPTLRSEQYETPEAQAEILCYLEMKKEAAKRRATPRELVETGPACVCLEVPASWNATDNRIDELDLTPEEAGALSVSIDLIYAYMELEPKVFKAAAMSSVLFDQVIDAFEEFAKKNSD